jgi:hypothetical protein
VEDSVTELRLVASVLVLIVFGALLVGAADARHDAIEPTVVFQTLVRDSGETLEDVRAVETPVIDGMFFTDEDWAEIDRQSDCLFEFIREHVGHDITLEIVLTAGLWTDALGGACLVIGEDDE